MTQPPEEAVRTLQGMGFMRNDVLEALKVLSSYHSHHTILNNHPEIQ